VSLPNIEHIDAKINIDNEKAHGLIGGALEVETPFPTWRARTLLSRHFVNATHLP
jgi:hypothetical protein